MGGGAGGSAGGGAGVTEGSDGVSSGRLGTVTVGTCTPGIWANTCGVQTPTAPRQPRASKARRRILAAAT